MKILVIILSILGLLFAGAIIVAIAKGRTKENKPEVTKKFPENSFLDELENKESLLTNEIKNLALVSHSMCQLKKAQLQDVSAMIREKQSYEYQCAMTAFKMKKSIELYNMLYHLIRTNTHIVNKLREEPQNDCIAIIGNITNLSEKELEENKKVISQVVKEIKMFSQQTTET